MDTPQAKTRTLSQPRSLETTHTAAHQQQQPQQWVQRVTTPETPQVVVPDYTMTIIEAAIAIIIAVAIVGLLLFVAVRKK